MNFFIQGTLKKQKSTSKRIKMISSRLDNKYHVGYRSQIQKWPVKPVIAVIEYIEKHEAKFTDK